MKYRLNLIATLCLISTPLMAGEIYRWVDENGKTHFGDRPTSKNAQSVEVKQFSGSGNTPPASGQGPQTEDLLRGYEQRRALKKQEEAKNQQQSTTIEKQCRYLKERLKYYDGYRHSRTDDSGKEYYLSDAEIDKEREQIESMVKKNCR